MSKPHRVACRAVCAALAAAVFCIHADTARAQGVDFDLLIESLKDRTQPAKLRPRDGSSPARGQMEAFKAAPKLKPVQELAEYVQCLRQGECLFLRSISGQEAAMRLSYSRLFASAYEEVLLSTKTHRGEHEPYNIKNVVSDFERIVGEEQAIDRLLAQKERHATAIAYLRAMQNGDVVFPGPQLLAPTPPVMLAQLMNAYPDVKLDINDRMFASIYREVREFASTRMKTNEQISAPEIIAEIRRLILRSAAEPPRSPPTICDKGEVIGRIIAFADFCPLLRLNQAARTISAEVAGQENGRRCRDTASAKLKAEFSTGTNIKEVCDQAARAVLAGESNAFEIAP